MENLTYDKIELQTYLNDPSVYPQLGQSLFRWRTRMVNLKKIFRNGNDDISCLFGCDSFDSQEHLLNCLHIKRNSKVVQDSNINYKQLFSKHVSKVKNVVILLDKLFKVREAFLQKQ